MVEGLVRILFDGASALAAGLLTYVALSALVSFGQWVFQRRRPRWLQQIARQLQRRSGRASVPSAKLEQGNRLSRMAILALALGLGVKAALTDGWLVAIFLLAVGGALYLYLGQHAGSLAREQVTDAVGELIAAYYSAYLVIPTVFGALSEAIQTQTNPFLQNAVRRALDAFGAGKTTEEVLAQLERDVQDPYLSQLVFILQHASASNQKEILNTLRDLSNRLDQRKRLKDRSRVALALVSGTVRFLQAANGAVIVLAVLAPFWWNFYAASVSHQVLLMLGGTLALLGSWYFETQLTQLRERVL